LYKALPVALYRQINETTVTKKDGTATAGSDGQGVLVWECTSPARTFNEILIAMYR
jgi:hypothetical protein